MDMCNKLSGVYMGWSRPRINDETVVYLGDVIYGRSPTVFETFFPCGYLPFSNGWPSLIVFLY
jgi:hypothetical protein